MTRQASESVAVVARLRGMSDLTVESLRCREELQRRLTALLSSHGYMQLDTPVIEPTELFLRKSGGELASQLFSFTDPGGREVSLRPEFTAPTIRHYLESPDNFSLPSRWQYCGPVFRFENSAMQADTPSGNQFTQIGGELLGSGGVLADAELLSLATSSLAEAGLKGWTLRMADLGILNSLLDPLGLSDRARAFVVQSVPQLSEGASAIARLTEQAMQLHIVGRPVDDDYLSQAVQGLDDDEARSVLLGVLRSNQLDQLGQRRPEDVVERLLRKIRRPDAEESLRLALASAAELAQVSGTPGEALAGALAVLRKAGADETAAERLRQLFELLPADQGGTSDWIAQEITLDFGLVRGLAYYNGIIFEVSHPDWPVPFGGGGRYDGLARDLGGSERLPALGFAYNLDALAVLAPAQGEDDSGQSGVLVYSAGDNAHSSAIAVARELRANGETVVLESGRVDYGEADLEALRDYAKRQSLGRVVLVSADGATSTHEVRP